MACCSACESGSKNCSADMQGPIPPSSLMVMPTAYGPNLTPQNVPTFGQTGTWTVFDAEVVSEAFSFDGKIPTRIMMF